MGGFVPQSLLAQARSPQRRWSEDGTEQEVTNLHAGQDHHKQSSENKPYLRTAIDHHFGGQEQERGGKNFASVHGRIGRDSSFWNELSEEFSKTSRVEESDWDDDVLEAVRPSDRIPLDRFR